MKRIETKIAQVRKLARTKGIIHARDLEPFGLPKQYLCVLHDEGFLSRTGRGLYMFKKAPENADIGLAQIAKTVPRGVVCLLSALRFHEIGTQTHREVWLALDRRAARPRNTSPKTHIVRFSGKAFSEGIQEHEVAGVTVRIYNPAKTVADCFKYRNKIGLDVALEALREVLRKRMSTADELWKYAKICRVSKVMRPYMEAVL
jgi:predicted transcriptional regulator of viral defense system